MNILTHAEVEAHLAELSGWELHGHKLAKTYLCKDFQAAIAFIVRMSFICEQLDHHPELHNVWNKVHLEITTHDAGNQLTDKDFRLAKEIDAIAGRPEH